MRRVLCPLLTAVQSVSRDLSSLTWMLVPALSGPCAPKCPGLSFGLRIQAERRLRLFTASSQSDLLRYTIDRLTFGGS